MSSACTLGGTGVVESGVTAVVEGRTELVTQAKRGRVHAVVACERIGITIRQTNTATVPFGTAFNLTRLPEVRLKIHACAVDIGDMPRVLVDGQCVRRCRRSRCFHILFHCIWEV